MSESFVLDWLNEQEYRAFPLKEAARKSVGGFDLPDAVLLDASFIYTTLPTTPLLTSIVADSTSVVFSFTGQTFTILKADPFPNYQRLSNGSLLVVGKAALDIPLGTHTFTSVALEKSVCYELGSAWQGVTSVNVNSNGALAANVVLKEGIQTCITVADSSVSIMADTLCGTPLSCRSFLGLTDDCADIISFINGVAPSADHVINLQRGNGVIILNDPDNHRIYIGLSFTEADICKTIQTNPDL